MLSDIPSISWGNCPSKFLPCHPVYLHCLPPGCNPAAARFCAAGNNISAEGIMTVNTITAGERFFGKKDARLKESSAY